MDIDDVLKIGIAASEIIDGDLASEVMDRIHKLDEGVIIIHIFILEYLENKVLRMLRCP